MEYFATSAVVELGLSYLLNLDVRDFPISLTYTASHSLGLLVCTGPTTGLTQCPHQHPVSDRTEEVESCQENFCKQTFKKILCTKV